MICQLAAEEISHEIPTLLSSLVTLGSDYNGMRYTFGILIKVFSLWNTFDIDSCKNLFNL